MNQNGYENIYEDSKHMLFFSVSERDGQKVGLDSQIYEVEVQ